MQKEITENYPARKYKRIKTKQKGKDRKTEIVRESKGQKKRQKNQSADLFQIRKQAPVLKMMKKHQNEPQLVETKAF